MPLGLRQRTHAFARDISRQRKRRQRIGHTIVTFEDVLMTSGQAVLLNRVELVMPRYRRRQRWWQWRGVQIFATARTSHAAVQRRGTRGVLTARMTVKHTVGVAEAAG